MSSSDAGKEFAEVSQAALRAKETADAEYQKIADAASVAASRFSASSASTSGAYHIPSGK